MYLIAWARERENSDSLPSLSPPVHDRLYSTAKLRRCQKHTWQPLSTNLVTVLHFSEISLSLQTLYYLSCGNVPLFKWTFHFISIITIGVRIVHFYAYCLHSTANEKVVEVKIICKGPLKPWCKFDRIKFVYIWRVHGKRGSLPLFITGDFVMEGSL